MQQISIGWVELLRNHRAYATQKSTLATTKTICCDDYMCVCCKSSIHATSIFLCAVNVGIYASGLI
jgi:hypothetical protein